MAQMVDALTREADGRRVPSIVFTKGGGAWLGRDRSHRLRCGRRRLDHRSATARRGGRGTGCAAGQPRSVGAVRAAGDVARRDHPRARQLRRRTGTRVQPGPRHHARRRPRSGSRCWSTRCAAMPRPDGSAWQPGVRRALQPVSAPGVGGGFAAEAPRSSSRKARRRILPTLVLGSSARKYTCLGTLYPVSSVRQWAISASAVSSGSFFTTNSATTSPESRPAARRRRPPGRRGVPRRRFRLRWVHVEAGHQNHVFLAVLDEHETLGVDAADVAGAQPIAEHHLLGFIRADSNSRA